MNTERDRQELVRDREGVRERGRHIETLGGVVTMLFLATVDLGLSGFVEASARPRKKPIEATANNEVVPLRDSRRRRLAAFAAKSVERGYAQTV